MVNLDFFFNCRKITIFRKFYEISQICSKLPGKYRLWIFFFFEKFRCLSKFSKLLVLVKTLKKKTSILVKIFENLNFGQGIGHFDFCKKKIENHDFSQISKNLAL